MVQSEQYHVDRLDWERRKAYVRRVDSEYYTDALSYAKVKILQVLRAAPRSLPHGTEPVAAEYGEVEVVRRAVGYKKIKFYTQENLGWGDIHLPEDVYHTQATWFTLRPELVAALAVPQSDLVDALRGVATLAHGIAAVLLMCEGRDLGLAIGDRSREWFDAPVIPGRTPGRGEVPGPIASTRAALPPPDEFEPTVFLYDHYSGGIGLAEALHPMFGALLCAARERLGACPCANGCPSCIGPDREVGPRAKATALRLLDLLLERAATPLAVSSACPSE
jgi:DEAD/DEAH box helicase domain-containing protein